MNEFAAVINYIEEHLEDNIDMKKIEQLAKVSEYNFKKIFSILSGSKVVRFPLQSPDYRFRHGVTPAIS